MKNINKSIPKDTHRKQPSTYSNNIELYSIDASQFYNSLMNLDCETEEDKNFLVDYFTRHENGSDDNIDEVDEDVCNKIEIKNKLVGNEKCVTNNEENKKTAKTRNKESVEKSDKEESVVKFRDNNNSVICKKEKIRHSKVKDEERNKELKTKNNKIKYNKVKDEEINKELKIEKSKINDDKHKREKEKKEFKIEKIKIIKIKDKDEEGNKELKIEKINKIKDKARNKELKIEEGKIKDGKHKAKNKELKIEKSKIYCVKDKERKKELKIEECEINLNKNKKKLKVIEDKSTDKLSIKEEGSTKDKDGFDNKLDSVKRFQTFEEILESLGDDDCDFEYREVEKVDVELNGIDILTMEESKFTELLKKRKQQ